MFIEVTNFNPYGVTGTRIGVGVDVIEDATAAELETLGPPKVVLKQTSGPFESTVFLTIEKAIELRDALESACCIADVLKSELLEGNGQDGQGSSNLVELKESGAVKGHRIAGEIINQAVISTVVADAINEAELGLYIVHKPGGAGGSAERDNTVKLPDLIADGDAMRCTRPWIEGVILRDGKYFAVSGHRLDALNFSGVDHEHSLMSYIGKYLLSPFRRVKGVEA